MEDKMEDLGQIALIILIIGILIGGVLILFK
jgi:hypothetical protein